MLKKEESKNGWFEKVGAVAVELALWARSRIPLALTLALLIAVFFLGMWSQSGAEHKTHEHATTSAPHKEKAPTIWTCSMHPQIRLPEPGLCPICNMELIPLVTGGTYVGPNSISVSPGDRALIGLETSTVEAGPVTRTFRVVGEIRPDETLVETVSSWIPGRVEKLHVDFTGYPIERGEPLLDLYSPDLMVAQQELLVARQMSDEFGAGSEESAREKLRLMGLWPKQIDAFLESQEPQAVVALLSPQSGTVLDLLVKKGQYLKEGTPVARVADLGTVWAVLDAFDSDVSWIQVGQDVVVEFPDSAMDSLQGKVSFVSPVMNRRSRTVEIRVPLENSNSSLRPGMLVRGTILGALSKGDDGKALLTVPVSAVLRTGRRGVVYVEEGTGDNVLYEARTVKLGPRAGQRFVIKEGLKEGEKVVTRGAFKLDSELQIQGKKGSMMSLPGEEIAAGRVPSAFVEALDPVYEAYFAMWEGLKDDQTTVARESAARLITALDHVNGGLLEEVLKAHWDAAQVSIEDGAKAIAAAQDIDTQREHFYPLSKAMLEMERRFGHAGTATHYEMFCPMARDNQGAIWLQPDDELLNPYFGASMLHCGEKRESFNPQKSPVPHQTQSH